MTLPPVPDPAHGPALRRVLHAVGYRADAVAALLGPVAERALARGDAAPARRVLRDGGPLETLVRLFLLAEPVTQADADAVFGALGRASGLLRPAAGPPGDAAPVVAAVDIRPYGEDWLVASELRPPGRGAPLDPGAVVGIGSASVTLAAAVPTTRDRPDGVVDILDLGTGCGVQALPFAATGARVTVTDTSDRAVAMSRLTAALSGVELETLVGDLWSPVEGRRFDRIVSNPPFVIGPHRFTYRDSAQPGDGLCAEVVGRAGDHLTPGGVAVLLASWIVGPDGHWSDRPRAWLPDGCDALVVQRELLDPAEHVALWLADGDESGTAGETLADEWLADLEEQGAEGVGYGLVLLRRLGGGPVDAPPDGTTGAPVVRCVDLGAEGGPPDGTRLQGWLDRVAGLRATPEVGTLRLARAPGLTVHRTSVATDDGWLPGATVLNAPGALPASATVDEVLVAIVSECDPSLPLDGVLDLVAAGAGRADLVTEALPAVLSLVEAGLLVPGTARGVAPAAPPRSQIWSPTAARRCGSALRCDHDPG